MSCFPQHKYYPYSPKSTFSPTLFKIEEADILQLNDKKSSIISPIPIFHKPSPNLNQNNQPKYKSQRPKKITTNNQNFRKRDYGSMEETKEKVLKRDASLSFEEAKNYLSNLGH